MDVGNYNINQLFSHLHAKLQETQDTQDIVINWSSLSNKMTFTGTAPIQLNPTSTCHALLGFSPDTIHVSVGNVLESDGMVDIRGITSVYIQSDIANDQYCYGAKGNLHHCLARIPVNAGAYGTITYAPFQALCAKVSRNHIERFRLYITDENGNHINFNRMKWTITLRIDFMTPAKLKPDTESLDAFLTLSRAPPDVRDYVTM